MTISTDIEILSDSEIPIMEDSESDNHLPDSDFNIVGVNLGTAEPEETVPNDTTLTFKQVRHNYREQSGSFFKPYKNKEDFKNKFCAAGVFITGAKDAATLTYQSAKKIPPVSAEDFKAQLNHFFSSLCLTAACCGGFLMVCVETIFRVIFQSLSTLFASNEPESIPLPLN